MKIQAIIDYLLELKTKYPWSAKAWKPVEDDIYRLSVRNNDKCLYLGVVGEFSTGKSTLINAMLGQQLLKEDVLQGTTCAPTFLRYGKQFDVIIEFSKRPIQILSQTDEFKTVYNQILLWFERVQNSGNKGVLQIPEEFSAIQEFIDKHTADEATAKDILRTTIYLNSPILKSGLVIVDTPGINAENPRHGLVAENAIKEYCDAVLVLVPASEPCSGVLCNFVRNHLQGIQCSSLAIVTKIDGIRERERNRMIKFVRERLESETDTEFADVLSCAALFALGNDPESRLSSEKQAELREQFYAMVQKIIHYLENSRATIIKRKLYQILKNLIPQVRKHLQRQQKEFQERKEALENNQLIDLNSYISCCKKIFREHFQTLFVSSSYYESRVMQIIFNWIDDVTSQAENTEQLKAIAESYNNAIQEAWRMTCEEIDNECNVFYEEAQFFCNWLQDNFNQEYRNLCRGYSHSISTTAALTNFSQVNFQYSSVPKKLLEELNSKEDSLMGGGAVAGLVLGTILLPGIGTVVGSLIGAALGGVFINMDEERKKMAQALKSIYFNKIKQTLAYEISNRIQSHQTTARESVEKWLKSLKRKYGKQIKELINEEQQEQDRLHSLIFNAETDLRLLQAWEKDTKNFLG